MKQIATPIKVGLVAVFGVACFVYFLGGVRKGGLGPTDSIRIHAVFDNARGLVRKSRVEIAGVNVGAIEEILLEKAKARVVMRIKKKIHIFENASVAKKQENILGDCYVDIVPGSEDRRQLQDGDEIKAVYSFGGTDAVLQQMELVASDVHEITSALKDVFGEEGVGSLRETVRAMQSVSGEVDKTIRASSLKLQEILDNFDRISRELYSVTREGSETIDAVSGDVRSITADIKQITAEMKKILANVGDVIGRGEGDMRESVASVREAMDRVNESLETLQNIANKVEKGEGTLGRLVTDEELVNSMESTLKDISLFLGRLTSLQTRVNIRTEALFNMTGKDKMFDKNYVTLEIAPREDKYYIFELIDDPRGKLTSVRKETTDEQTQTKTVQSIEERSYTTFKFSAQFARRFYFLTLRLGIMENTGGTGFNLHFFDEDLELRTDLFDFAGKSRPRWKSFASYTFLKHLYVAGGVDDILNKEQIEGSPFQRMFFFGGGIKFTDDDLKSLLTAMPSIP